MNDDISIYNAVAGQETVLQFVIVTDSFENEHSCLLDCYAELMDKQFLTFQG